MIIMENITMLKRPGCCMLMTLKAMTIIILTKAPLLTTSPQSRSCQLPHWKQWWRGNSTGCLSSGWAWEGRLAITISKTCLTNHSVFNQPHPNEIFNKFKMPKKQLLEKCSIWPIWNYSQWNSETWWSSLRSICKASSSGFLLIQLRFNMLCISIGVRLARVWLLPSRTIGILPRMNTDR